MVSSLGLEDVGQAVPLPPNSGTENVSLPRPSIPCKEASSRAIVRFVPQAGSTPHERTNLTPALQQVLPGPIEGDALSGEFF